MGSNGASPMAPPLPPCEDDATRASYGTPDQLSPSAAWGRNRFASFEQSSTPTPVFLPGSPGQEKVLETDPPSPPAASRIPRPANTTSVSHSFREEISVDPTSLVVSPEGTFRLRGDLMHVVPYRVFTEGAGPDDTWSRLIRPDGPGDPRRSDGSRPPSEPTQCLASHHGGHARPPNVSGVAAGHLQLARRDDACTHARKPTPRTLHHTP